MFAKVVEIAGDKMAASAAQGTLEHPPSSSSETQVLLANQIDFTVGVCQLPKCVKTRHILSGTRRSKGAKRIIGQFLFDYLITVLQGYDNSANWGMEPASGNLQADFLQVLLLMDDRD